MKSGQKPPVYSRRHAVSGPMYTASEFQPFTTAKSMALTAAGRPSLAEPRSNEVQDAIVDFVTNADPNGNRAFCDRAGNTFVVQPGQANGGAAAAHNAYEIDLQSHQPVNGSHD